MKLPITFLVFVLFCFGQMTYAQTLAITEYGDSVYIYDDGSWSYSPDEMPLNSDNELDFLSTELELDTNFTQFSTPKSSKKEITSEYGFFSIKYDDTKWKRVPAGTLNDEAEFAFEAKGKDIYCIVISEEIEIGLESIYKIALENVRQNIGGDPKSRKTEIRTVNGATVLQGIFDINYSGLNMTFDSYYYSGEGGTIQFSTWTGSNLHGKYQEDIEELLNGLIIK